ncbi:MAG: hypothetical protein Q7U92_25430, partial [Bradyrhizobium sp.]|nr:hypothetical protein [Bradyrhizobium sp.]
MNAIAIPKSGRTNRLEGIALSAALQGLPTFAAAVLLMKLFGSEAIIGDPGGAAFFVVTTSILSGAVSAWLGPKYPKLFHASYEPLFFDAALSLKQKVTAWSAQTRTQQQLVMIMVMLSVLGVAVVSV